MKKARYVFAAVGAAPALGMMAPAVAAAPAANNAPARPAKTVKLTHPATTAVAASTSPTTAPTSSPTTSPTASPLHTCHAGTEAGKWSTPNHRFDFQIIHYGHCVDAQRGTLDIRATAYQERVRAYSQDGVMIFHRRVKGEIVGSHTVFPNSNFSALNWNPVYNICAALVLNSSPNRVYFGPVCIQP